MKNGELLERASNSFDVFITIDSNLPYQQALERFAVGVVLLKAPSNRLADLEPLIPQTLECLEGLEPGQFRKVER